MAISSKSRRHCRLSTLPSTERATNRYAVFWQNMGLQMFVLSLNKSSRTETSRPPQLRTRNYPKRWNLLLPRQDAQARISSWRLIRTLTAQALPSEVAMTSSFCCPAMRLDFFSWIISWEQRRSEVSFPKMHFVFRPLFPHG